MYIELPEKLKEIIREKVQKDIAEVFRCDEAWYFAAAEMILMYLKEFKTVKTEQEFKKEVELLWWNSQPATSQHPIRDALYGRAGTPDTKTYKIMHGTNFGCMDVSVVKYVAQVLHVSHGVWENVCFLYKENKGAE